MDLHKPAPCTLAVHLLLLVGACVMDDAELAPDQLGSVEQGLVEAYEETGFCIKKATGDHPKWKWLDGEGLYIGDNETFNCGRNNTTFEFVVTNEANAALTYGKTVVIRNLKTSKVMVHNNGTGRYSLLSIYPQYGTEFEICEPRYLSGNACCDASGDLQCGDPLMAFDGSSSDFMLREKGTQHILTKIRNELKRRSNPDDGDAHWHLR